MLNISNIINAIIVLKIKYTFKQIVNNHLLLKIYYSLYLLFYIIIISIIFTIIHIINLLLSVYYIYLSYIYKTR